MKRIIIVAWVSLAACSGASPTAPTPLPPPVVVVPPVVTPPAPPRNPLLDDPRFDRAFYRQFALNGHEAPNALQPLRRLTEAPRIYLRTIDDAGAAIDTATLNATAAALESTAGTLTGVFGVAGLERGTESREGQRGWITVRWSAEPSPDRFCGYGVYAGDRITLYPRTPGCRCAGGPAVRLKTVRHEFGHVLGFYHTDSPNDLMFSGGQACDMQPSAREVFHATVAYQMPVGSLEP